MNRPAAAHRPPETEGRDDLSARQVADRLGVELATVYAYASRGALSRVPAPEGRGSRYRADEVEALARRSRPRSARRRTTAVDVVIGTTVSEIGDGWIRYRDHDLVELVRSEVSFEEVCQLLWTGALAPPPALDADACARVVDAAATTAAALPSDAGITARLATGAAAVAALLPTRRGAPDASSAGALVVEALVASLPHLGTPAPSEATVAARLWPRLSPLPATQARVRALEVAMVLLAEHELATSTLAVRVAASARANAAGCVLAGLGAMAGPLHGKAAIGIQRRLLDREPPAARDAGHGFGHPVHVGGDPRYAPLAAAVGPIATDEQRAAIAADVRPARRRPAPNVDAALGALGLAAQSPLGATEAIFAIARTAGWLAHAFEEADEPPLRFRGRTLYRGPR